jgi:hypothetical protein
MWAINNRFNKYLCYNTSINPAEILMVNGGG